MRNSTEEIRDILHRGTKGFKSVIVFNDGNVHFTNEDITMAKIGGSLYGRDEFIHIGNISVRRSAVSEILPMYLYLKIKEREDRIQEQERKGKKPTLP